MFVLGFPLLLIPFAVYKWKISSAPRTIVPSCAR